MKIMLKRIVVLLIVAGAAYLIWGQRYRIEGLSNNNLKIQGTWYQVEMNRKGVTAFHFSERIITKEGTEWGSYEMRKNDEIDVMVGNTLTTYELSFPDDENMVWSAEIDGRVTPVVRWRE